MLLAQLTDTHIKAERRAAYGHVDTAAFLAAAVGHLNAFVPSIDAVVVTGDLTDSGSDEEYAALRDILGGLTIPWFVIPGNHDDPKNLLAAFDGVPYLAACRKFVHYVIDDYPIRMIGLDTSVAGASHGWLCDERLAWLDQQLASDGEKPVFIFQHHPPFETGIRHMDVQNLLNWRNEFDVLFKYGQVRHVACGHVHRAAETSIGGIGVSIAPNAAHAVTLDLTADGPATFTMEPPSVRLFRIREDGGVTSHLSFVGGYAGPYPFFSADGSLVD